MQAARRDHYDDLIHRTRLPACENCWPTRGFPMAGGHHVASRRSSSLSRFGAFGCVLLAVAAMVVVSPGSLGAATPSGWNIVTSPSASTTSNEILLGSACANAQECWGVGATVSNGGRFEPLLDQWDGASWTIAASPAPPGADGYGLFNVTCVTASDCWAVGAITSPEGGNPMGILTENWNGAAWSVVPSPTPTGAVGAMLEGVSCTSVSNCWAAGFTTDENGAALRSLTEQWNGSVWSIVSGVPTGQAYDQLNSISCISSADCWAVGTAGAVQQNPKFLPIYPAAAGDQGLIEHWDGINWSIVPSFTSAAPDGGYLSAVTCAAPSDCWAAGSTTDSTGSSATTLMERWNGSTWSTVGNPDPPGSVADTFSAVTCLDEGSCWAVGASGTKGGGGGTGFQPNAFIEYWDGTAWSNQASPNVTSKSLLASVSCVRGSSCWAVGGAATNLQNGGVLQTLIEQMILPPSSNQGLYMAAADGGVFALGNARFYGSMAGTPLTAPVVGIAATPDGGGYWEVASDGGIFAFGDAHFYGSMGGRPLDAPVVGIAVTPDGEGYWEVASDGGIFAFGDARFEGSMGGQRLNRPISGLAQTPNDDGYWLSASDGGVFAFGNAGYSGSVPGQGIVSASPVVAISATPDDGGYWLAGSDGSLYCYGDATFLGSLSGIGLTAPISGIVSP
jgi:hypothetical protein